MSERFGAGVMRSEIGWRLATLRVMCVVGVMLCVVVWGVQERWWDTGSGWGAVAASGCGVLGGGCSEGVSRWGRTPVLVPWPSRGNGVAYVRRIEVPWAGWGVAYFAGIGLLSGALRAGFGGRISGWLVYGLSRAGLVGSLLMVGLMAGPWATWCGWCVAVHGVNAGVAVLIRRPRAAGASAVSQSAGSRVSWWRLVGALGVRGAALVGVLLMVGMYRQACLSGVRSQASADQAWRLVHEVQRDGEALLAVWSASPRVDHPVMASGLGMDDAGDGERLVVDVLVVGREGCQACGCLMERLEALRGAWGPGFAVRRVEAVAVPELVAALEIEQVPVMFVNGRRLPELCDTPGFWRALYLRSRSAVSPTSAAQPRVMLEVVDMTGGEVSGDRGAA